MVPRLTLDFYGFSHSLNLIMVISYPQLLIIFGSIGIKIGLIFVEIVQCVLYLCGGITEESFVKWHRGWPWTSTAFAIALSL